MSSKKKLKKLINNSMSILYSDCIFHKVFNMKPNVEKADKIIHHIVEVHNHLLSRLSSSESKNSKADTKSYYKKLKSYLKDQVNIFEKEIQELD